MFFGFAQHKTFVEHFARPQTKTRSGLSISIHPSAIRRLGGEECGGDGGDAPRGGRLVGSPPESRAASLVLCGQSRPGGSRGADTHSPAFAFERLNVDGSLGERSSWLPAPALPPSPQREPGS